MIYYHKTTRTYLVVGLEIDHILHIKEWCDTENLFSDLKCQR